MVGIDAINAGASTIASGGPVSAADSGSTAKTESGNNVQEVPIGILINVVFMTIYSYLGTIGQALADKVEQRTKTLKDLTKLLNGIDNWNDPPGVPKMPADPNDPVYQDRIAKTDELLLNGVGIPQNDYDYAKYNYGTDPQKVGYAKLPIADFDSVKNHVSGELYAFPKDGSPTEKTYSRYLYTDINPVLREASSPLPLKTKLTPGSDFSAYQPGDLVLDKETQKYYRVANDKTGVEVEDYPLQKFVYAPSSDVIDDLKNQINTKSVEVRDLSKKDALDEQDLAGEVNKNSIAFGNLLSAFVTACNAVIRNIHS
jgi:hypothetical protein